MAPAKPRPPTARRTIQSPGGQATLPTTREQVRINVAVGSQPDLPPFDRDVRFAALNRLKLNIAPCPKSATSGLMWSTYSTIGQLRGTGFGWSATATRALAGTGSRTISGCLLRSSGKLFPIYRKPQPRLLIDPLLGSFRFQLAFLCFASVSLCGSL
jgi:hypothetical protein